jgi:Ca2+-binding EF-hand superfamily protein
MEWYHESGRGREEGCRGPGIATNEIPGIATNERNKEWVADVFKEFDKDMNGTIDEKELQDFVFSLGETWSEETCKKVVEKLDTDEAKWGT